MTARCRTTDTGNFMSDGFNMALFSLDFAVMERIADGNPGNSESREIHITGRCGKQ